MKQGNKLKSGTLLIFILTAGVFGIINTEMGVIGILPLIDETFHVTVPQAGWTISVFALVVAASAPITPLLFSGINRKKVMLLAMGLFTLSNVISMLTTNFTVLLIARALPAFLHPVYVSMALTVAASTGSKEQASRAVAKVFIGVSAGMVLGVPVTSYIASELSYEMGMLFFTVVNALVLVATIVFVPSMPVRERLSYGTQLSVLKKNIVWYSIAAVTLINGALFGFFSYMSDFLQRMVLADADSRVISPSPRRGGNTNPICDKFMKHLYLSVILLVVMTACNNQKKTEIMEEKKEPVLGLGTPISDNFTGEAWLRMLSAQTEYDCSIYNVTFAPGTRLNLGHRCCFSFLIITCHFIRCKQLIYSNFAGDNRSDNRVIIG